MNPQHIIVYLVYAILSTAYYKEEVKIKSCVNNDLIYVVYI